MAGSVQKFHSIIASMNLATSISKDIESAERRGENTAELIEYHRRVTLNTEKAIESYPGDFSKDYFIAIGHRPSGFCFD